MATLLPSTFAVKAPMLALELPVSAYSNGPCEFSAATTRRRPRDVTVGSGEMACLQIRPTQPLTS